MLLIRDGRIDGRFALLISGLVVVGVPCVAILWEAANQLLSGRVPGRLILLAIPALIVFSGVLVLLARSLDRLSRAD